jgi:hypothetical protein
MRQGAQVQVLRAAQVVRGNELGVAAGGPAKTALPAFVGRSLARPGVSGIPVRNGEPEGWHSIPLNCPPEFTSGVYRAYALRSRTCSAQAL